MWVVALEEEREEGFGAIGVGGKIDGREVLEGDVEAGGGEGVDGGGGGGGEWLELDFD